MMSASVNARCFKIQIHHVLRLYFDECWYWLLTNHCAFLQSMVTEFSRVYAYVTRPRGYFSDFFLLNWVESDSCRTEVISKIWQTCRESAKLDLSMTTISLRLNPCVKYMMAGNWYTTRMVCSSGRRRTMFLISAYLRSSYFLIEASGFCCYTLLWPWFC